MEGRYLVPSESASVFRRYANSFYIVFKRWNSNYSSIGSCLLLLKKTEIRKPDVEQLIRYNKNWTLHDSDNHLLLEQAQELDVDHILKVITFACSKHLRKIVYENAIRFIITYNYFSRAKKIRLDQYISL